MPVRKIPKNYLSVTGMVASTNFDRLTGYESTLERDCIKLIIFNTNVAAHEEQPVKIFYIGYDGKQHNYTPDILIKYRKDIAPPKYWKPLLIEVKPKDVLRKSWLELKPKIRAGRQYAREQGWDFTILTESDIRTPFLDNIKFLLEYKKIPTNEDNANTLLESLKILGKTSPETLLVTISKDSIMRAQLLPTLWQLVASQKIHLDITKKMTMHSHIWLPSTDTEGEKDESFLQYGAGRGRRTRWQAIYHHSYFGAQFCPC